MATSLLPLFGQEKAYGVTKVCELCLVSRAREVSANGQSLLLCWYFLMSSPEPLLIEKLMMKITTKVDRIPSAGYGLIAI